MEKTRISLGKRVAGDLYVHICAMSQLPRSWRERAEHIASAAETIPERDFNVIKFDENTGIVLSLLSYQDFDDSPFPELVTSWFVLADGSIRKRHFGRNGNPPILHRKELLLPPDHPRWREFAQLTEALEARGLFSEPTKIGYKKQWQQRLEAASVRVNGHIVETATPTETTVDNDVDKIKRHRTAITRYGFSTPMRALVRHGFLDGSRSVFDYGCGKGDDLRLLEANGVPAAGWDPYFQPDSPKTPSDIVNIGFVLNVIENPNERANALQDAFSLSRTALSVAVIPAGKVQYRGELCGDGVLTRRGTFQKFYTQEEMRDYLLSVLDVEPIAVAPGIFFVFKDKVEEQRFLESRYSSCGCVRRLIGNLPKPSAEERLHAFHEANRELLEAASSVFCSCLSAPSQVTLV